MFTILQIPWDNVRIKTELWRKLGSCTQIGAPASVLVSCLMLSLVKAREMFGRMWWNCYQLTDIWIGTHVASFNTVCFFSKSSISKVGAVDTKSNLHILPAWRHTGSVGRGGLTCSVRRRVLRKNPKRHPMTTASTDMMRSPFCLQTFFTLTHTASKATAIVSHLSRDLSATHQCSQANALKSRCVDENRQTKLWKEKKNSRAGREISNRPWLFYGTVGLSIPFVLSLRQSALS